ncbi:endonuclease III [soil metagenome]
MGKAKVLKIIEILEDLYHSKQNVKPVMPPIDMLIAVKLSQNTTDKSSYKAFRNLKDSYKNWDEISNADPDEIKEKIRVCGLANTKTKNIQELLTQIKKDFNGFDLSALEKLSNEEIYERLLCYNGIGVKTISCLLAFSFGRNVFPVDTHVHRILNRLGIVKTNTAEQTFENTKSLIPAFEMPTFHTNLIKFGRNICKSAAPLCGVCPLYNNCRYPEKRSFHGKTKNAVIRENNFLIIETI